MTILNTDNGNIIMSATKYQNGTVVKTYVEKKTRRMHMEFKTKGTAVLAKIAIIVGVIGYVIFPDLIPGPIDDIIVAFLGKALQDRITVTA